MRPNHKNQEYNQTLEHVYETAMANIDDTHRKRKGHRKTRVPNILSLCWKSAADDVVATSSSGSHIRDELGANTGTTNASQGEVTRVPVTHATVVDGDDALFLLKDDELGQASHNRTRSGLIRTTMLHATKSINSWQGRHKQDVNDEIKF